MKGPYPIPPPPEMPVTGEAYTKLQVIASPMINQDQLWKLFDIVPGIWNKNPAIKSHVCHCLVLMKKIYYHSLLLKSIPFVLPRC